MQIDQNKFMNVMLEKTNQKLGQMQSQVILLETQLQFALESIKSLNEDLEKVKKKKDKEKSEEFSTPE